MFSRSIKSALEAIAEHDVTPWVSFSFYPCPVGANTVEGCKTNPCPPKIQPCDHKTYEQCCVQDKFEDCVVAQLGCNDYDADPHYKDCGFDTRLKLAKFVGCFEGGGKIEEDVCNNDGKKCIDEAGLATQYKAIEACWGNGTATTAASAPIDKACAAQQAAVKPPHEFFWPHVQINGKQAGGEDCVQDSCVIPILPVLCKAYAGATTPKSCKLYAQGLLPSVV